MADDFVTVQLVGRDDVVAAIKELREELPNTWLRNSLRAGAQLLLEAVLRYVPYRTGKLARNLSLRTQHAGEWLRARVVVNTIGKASGPDNAFYWRFLEKGWRDRAGKPHREEFIEAPVEAHEREAAQLVIDAVGQALDKAESKAR
jgi:HK97 gp10 family phage protein